ncbi:MAG: DNA translocase FtsK 4TM domain-containing protein [Patescibacteria group bacterium]|nr:DNA translocase FtsK 4TM domain-containing protein [Patescibacteria group bacterium]
MSRTPKNRSAVSRNDDFGPRLSHGLLSVLLFVVAGLATLSFFDMAGVAGKFIDSLLAIVFGQVRYAFPVILIITAILLIKDLEYEYRSTHILGSVLFFLSFNGMFHLAKPPSEMVSLALQGYGGGLFGLALAWPLGTYVGWWGGIIILAGILLVSIIFLFNTSLAELVALNKKMILALGWFGQQVVAFFGGFKKEEKLTMRIEGDYEPMKKKSSAETEDENEEEETEEMEEDAPVFASRAVGKEIKPADKTAEAKADEIVAKETRPTTLDVNYQWPPMELLYISKSKPSAGDIKSNAETIKETLHNFGIETDMGEIRVGPTVTQYSLKPAKGIKLTRITGLSNDLALALAAHPIRIEAPIPGKSLVGIEVPNEKVAMVTLRELLESQEYKTRGHNLTLALGKDVAGKVWFADLPKMPHLLIAGTTGSGKTVCINTVILSLLYQNSPETLRFIMVDPKRVELTLYNGIPHLLTPVITDPAKTVSALKWTIGEMERRFDTLAAHGVRDIASYNKRATEKMPHIVFVIDELADLMAMAPAEVEAGIIRIAQMARAVGIHLIVATQRPSVEVITGLMKANIPARIAFSVASIIDSRTILDCPGAEKLLGRGDMLLLTAELSKPKRIQGAFVSEEEMKRVVDHIKGDEPPIYDEAIVSKSGSGGGTMNLFGGPSDDKDVLFEEARAIVIESGKASASLLQRRMKVGYARAARLLDEMEEAGIVGPADGAKPREVFTDHLMPTAEEEMPANEQTMDAGGTVFDEPASTDTPEPEESATPEELAEELVEEVAEEIAESEIAAPEPTEETDEVKE